MVRKAIKRKAPATLGEHIRARRRELRLLQKEAAAEIGVTTDTVHNWETGKTDPPIGVMPQVLTFLGYDPFDEPQTLPERMLA